MPILPDHVRSSDIRNPTIWERVLLRERPRSRRVSILLQWFGFRLSYETHTEDGDQE